LGTLVCLVAVFGMSRFSLFGGVALLVSCLALFIQGGSAGAVFAEAARSVIGGGGEVGRGVGWAYGFELLGSALGGLLCAVAVIPVFGIIWALALALSAALAVFLVSLVRRSVMRS